MRDVYFAPVSVFARIDVAVNSVNYDTSRLNFAGVKWGRAEAPEAGFQPQADARYRAKRRTNLLHDRDTKYSAASERISSRQNSAPATTEPIFECPRGTVGTISQG